MRFATARDVLLAFPEMVVAQKSSYDGTPSRSFLERLIADGSRAEAVTFLAHLLRRRDAIWWAATCVRGEPKSFSALEQPLFSAVAKWVADPNEEDRVWLLASGNGSDLTRPAIWLALAVGWSGGLLRPDGMSKAMCQPYMSPAAVRSALLLASSFAADGPTFLDQTLERGVRMIASSQN
jgi:hypothetical protein